MDCEQIKKAWLKWMEKTGSMILVEHLRRGRDITKLTWIIVVVKDIVLLDLWIDVAMNYTKL